MASENLGHMLLVRTAIRLTRTLPASLLRQFMDIRGNAPESASGQELSKVLKVQNKMGIHARPAAMIVRISNKFSEVDLWVEKDDEQVNGKSIMGLMMLAAGNGSELRFIATGKHAEALLNELEDLFARKFEET